MTAPSERDAGRMNPIRPEAPLERVEGDLAREGIRRPVPRPESSTEMIRDEIGVQRRPPRTAIEAPAPQRRTPYRRLLTRESLRDAVIMTEILGKPKSLRPPDLA